jgi:hypothetical protein
MLKEIWLVVNTLFGNGDHRLRDDSTLAGMDHASVRRMPVA